MRPLRMRDRFAILGLGVLCLPLLVFFGPYLEEGREESRQKQAYFDVGRISEDIRGDDASAPAPEKLDPWGNPYQMRRTAEGVMRVLSTGANGLSPPGGIDADDVYSDMPITPFEKYRRQRCVEWCIGLVETVAVFLLTAVVYLSSRRNLQ